MKKYKLRAYLLVILMLISYLLSYQHVCAVIGPDGMPICSGMNTYAVAWFQPTSQHTFLVLGNYCKRNQLYLFNHRTCLLSEILQEFPFADDQGTVALSVMQTHDGSVFLAEGNYDQPNTLYRFDLASCQFRYELSFSPDSRTTTVSWLLTPDGTMLLAEGNYGQKNKLYVFDAQAMTLVELAQKKPFNDDESFTEAFDWLCLSDNNAIFLAEGGHGVHHIYEFDGMKKQLSEISQSQPFSQYGHTYDMQWLEVNEETALLAQATGGENKLYLFNRSAKKLQELVQPKSFFQGLKTHKMRWLLLPGGRIFLAQANYNQRNRLYEFDLTTQMVTLKQEFSCIADSRSLAWLLFHHKIFLAEGNGCSPSQLYVLDIPQGALLNKQALEVIGHRSMAIVDEEWDDNELDDSLLFLQ